MTYGPAMQTRSSAVELLRGACDAAISSYVNDDTMCEGDVNDATMFEGGAAMFEGDRQRLQLHGDTPSWVLTNKTCGTCVCLVMRECVVVSMPVGATSHRACQFCPHAYCTPVA